MASYLELLRQELATRGVSPDLASAPALASLVMQPAAGLRDRSESPSYLGGLKQGLAQGGLVGGLYSAAGLNPSNEWYPGVMRATQDIGRALQGAAIGDPTFTTQAAQADQALGLRAAEYDLQARQAAQQQEMADELSMLDPNDRLGIANVYMRYGFADKALETLKNEGQKAPPRRKTSVGDEQLTEEMRPDGSWFEVARAPRYKPTTNVNTTVMSSDPLKAKLTMRKDFEAETRPYIDAAESAQLTIQAVDQASQTGNWLAAVEAVTRFAKATDPTTGVREGELAKFLGGGSAVQKFRNAISQFQTGKPTQETLTFMRDAAERIVRGVQPYYQARRKVFEDLARSEQMDPAFLGEAPQLNTPSAIPPGVTVRKVP